MKPAFKVDENLPREVAALLRGHGYDAVTVHDQALVGRSDPDIASVCKAENRALVTLDLDFSNIRAYPPEQHPGLVVLRSDHHDKPSVMALVTRAIPLLATEIVAGKLGSWRRIACESGEAGTDALVACLPAALLRCRNASRRRTVRCPGPSCDHAACRS